MVQATVEERFWAKVRKTETCWLWTASSVRGYGQFTVGPRCLKAHRFAYELLVGPIPEGLTIDHVKARGCTSRLCVNPAHLEPVSMRENLLRGDTFQAANARKTHCSKGHALSGDNLYLVRRGKNFERHCRQCKRDWKLQRRNRKG